jgi:hypothetical protein
MNITDDFNEKKYVVIKNLLSPEDCKTACNLLFTLYENQQTIKDTQCPLSDSIYGNPFFDSLLNELKDYFSDISGKKLIPTYSYARIYRKGEKLEIHKDRAACEISATITLGFDQNAWSIYFNDEEKTDQSNPLVLDVGDVVLYKGTEIYHWRDVFDGEWQCQVFLHYVDKEGPYKNEKYDCREKIGTPAETKKQVICSNEKDTVNYWFFENAISNDFCDQVIGKYSKYDLEKGLIGGDDLGHFNKTIRNVSKCLIPINEPIGFQLIGSGFVANQQAWKFDINNCVQIEYLKYEKEGRYKTHIDTFMSYPHNDCRKLTVLAFLNDDFEGGKFYLRMGDEKIYPHQSKGTIIVFPSFLLHGVEDIIRGTRHSVVCWLLGPYFR